MGRSKDHRCREPEWLRDMEARLCSIVIIISFTAALISLALFTDSALLTLSVDLTPAVCVTTNVRNYSGSSKCMWTSCRQSCTATVYNCSQIYVNYRVNSSDMNDTVEQEVDYFNSFYMNDTVEQEVDYSNSSLLSLPLIKMSSVDFEMNVSDSNSSTVDEIVNGSVPLYVNPNGCGYEPEVSCPKFYKEYGSIGISFQCEVIFNSDTQTPLVIPDSTNSVVSDKSTLFSCLVLSLLPLILFFVSFFYVYWRKLFKPKPKKMLRLYVKKKSPEEQGSFYERKVRHINMIREGRKPDYPAEKLSIKSFESHNSKQEANKQSCPSYIKLPAAPSTTLTPHYVDQEQFL